MSHKLKYFFYAGVSVIVITFIISANYKSIVYFNDYIKSLFIRTFNLYGSFDENISIIGSNYKVYKKTFSNIPDEIFHFANMLFYKGNKNIGFNELSSSLIELTDFYKLNSFKNSLSSKNNINKDIINSGELILIEKALPPFTIDIKKSRAKTIKFTKGLYFTGDRAGSDVFLSKLPELKSMGINAIVFDVKDVTGIVHTKSRVKEAVDYNFSQKGNIDNLSKLIRECRENGMYIIARMAVFHDQLLWTSDPSSRIKSKSTGKDWNPKSRELWCDPSSKKVQDYNIALAVEVAEAGVDEIQFDYIRFPTLGDKRDADFAYSYGKMERFEVITHFLQRTHESIGRAGAFLSIDIFGVVAWGKDVDINSTGQQISLLAKHCDVISPMLYPSHFNDNFDGFKNPGDNPYHFILHGCKKVRELAGGKVIIRPWLQAFALRTSNYNAAYINEQIRASNDAGAYGYLFWNASNRYNEVFKSNVQR
ncbi:MAG: putative glycoside hydrolase [Leptospirales bacterium]|nr:putative glycoside hydrolase [Leptospirales bacterium]